MPFVVNQRGLMADALAELMETQPIEKISVQDIADKCHITRTTFYRYFEDKYALMLYVFQGDSANIFEECAKESDSHYDLALGMLKRIQKRPAFYQKAFSYYAESSFYESFKRLLTSGMMNLYEQYGPGNIPKNEYEYLAISYIASIADIIRAWTQNNYKEPAETIVGLMNEACPKRLIAFLMPPRH